MFYVTAFGVRGLHLVFAVVTHWKYQFWLYLDHPRGFIFGLLLLFCAMIKCVRSRSCPKRRAVYLGPHASVAGVCATLPQNLGGAVDASTTSSWCSLQIKDDQKSPNMTKHQLHPPLLEAAWELHYETGWSCYTSNVLGLFKKSELQNPSKFHS